MGKRAPILPDNYNPVGERLRRILQPPPPVATRMPPAVETTEQNIELPSITESRPGPASRVVEMRMDPREEREPIPETPVDRELKGVSVRFRCTLSERKKWHEITRELTGDHNNLSHFVRAAMLLVESAHEPLKRLAVDIQRLRKPATTDSLGITYYEHRLAQYLYDAIRSAGRLKG